MSEIKLYERLAKADRHERDAWGRMIATLLQRLELSAAQRARAESAYAELGHTIAARLAVSEQEISVFPQGSMRTQTTIPGRSRTKFDLDIVVRFEKEQQFADPDAFFARFGEALGGNEQTTGKPEPKRRCWRLQYPNEPFYFDVTPAVPAGSLLQAPLRVRDPETGWSPSNPVEFAEWFCDRAKLRFPFQAEVQKSVMDSRASVEPLPDERVGLDDILRRTVQLLKLHRDNCYWAESDERAAAQPISVIIVTLATHAYEALLRTRALEFGTAIEVVLAVVETMPQFVGRNSGRYEVRNPALSSENFADRWNHDGGQREAEFRRWHKRLQGDLEKFLAGPEGALTAAEVRSLFGDAGVEAWRQIEPPEQAKSNVLQGLLASATPGQDRRNPTEPIRVGSKGTLA